MHIHEIGPKEDLTTMIICRLQETAQSLNRQIKLIKTRSIKTYNPQYTHFVIDVQINEN
jgi:tRNA G37 N-methylase Trm5